MPTQRIPNADLLRLTLHYVTEHPNRWDQAHTQFLSEDGTSGDYLAWVAVLAGGRIIAAPRGAMAKVELTAADRDQYPWVFQGGDPYEVGQRIVVPAYAQAVLNVNLDQVASLGHADATLEQLTATVNDLARLADACTPAHPAGPNRALLRGAMAHVRLHPELWDQRWYWAPAEPGAGSQPTADLLGRAVTLSGASIRPDGGITAVVVRERDLLRWPYLRDGGYTDGHAVPLPAYARALLRLNAAQFRELANACLPLEQLELVVDVFTGVQAA